MRVTGTRLINVAQAATQLGRSEKAVRMMVQRQVLPFIKTGRRVQFDPTELNAWIASHRCGWA
jgi:excisionase family DNA binding protein